MFHDFVRALRRERAPVMTLERAREDAWIVESAYGGGAHEPLYCRARRVAGRGAHVDLGDVKDSPHEGFTWRKYLRSAVLSTLIAAAWQAAIGFDLASAGARLVLFGLTYVSERGLVELYKTFLREEDQSKYTIPMQFHVKGRVVRSRRVR